MPRLLLRAATRLRAQPAPSPLQRRLPDAPSWCGSSHTRTRGKRLRDGLTCPSLKQSCGTLLPRSWKHHRHPRHIPGGFHKGLEAWPCFLHPFVWTGPPLAVVHSIDPAQRREFRENPHIGQIEDVRDPALHRVVEGFSDDLLAISHKLPQASAEGTGLARGARLPCDAKSPRGFGRVGGQIPIRRLHQFRSRETQDLGPWNIPGESRVSTIIEPVDEPLGKDPAGIALPLPPQGAAPRSIPTAPMGVPQILRVRIPEKIAGVEGVDVPSLFKRLEGRRVPGEPRVEAEFDLVPVPAEPRPPFVGLEDVAEVFGELGEWGVVRAPPARGLGVEEEVGVEPAIWSGEGGPEIMTLDLPGSCKENAGFKDRIRSVLNPREGVIEREAMAFLLFQVGERGELGPKGGDRVGVNRHLFGFLMLLAREPSVPIQRQRYVGVAPEVQGPSHPRPRQPFRVGHEGTMLTARLFDTGAVHPDPALLARQETAGDGKGLALVDRLRRRVRRKFLGHRLPRTRRLQHVPPVIHQGIVLETASAWEAVSKELA